MASNAISSFGTLVKIDDGTGSYTTIAELRDIDGPKLAMATAEVTNQSSTGGYREFIGTLLDGGEVTFDIGFIPTNSTQDYSNGLLHDMVNKTLRNFELVFPDTGATTWTFAALITAFEPKEPVDGDLTASVTLKLSGQPTLA